MTDFYFLDNCNFPLLKSEHSKINIKLNLSHCLYYMLTIIDVVLEKKIYFKRTKWEILSIVNPCYQMDSYTWHFAMIRSGWATIMIRSGWATIMIRWGCATIMIRWGWATMMITDIPNFNKAKQLLLVLISI